MITAVVGGDADDGVVGLAFALHLIKHQLEQPIQVLNLRRVIAAGSRPGGIRHRRTGATRCAVATSRAVLRLGPDAPVGRGVPHLSRDEERVVRPGKGDV